MQASSSRERLRTVLNGGVPDCVPVATSIDSQFASRHIGQSLTSFYRDVSVRVEGFVAVQEHYGLDLIQQGAHSNQYVELFGGESEYRDDTYPTPKAPVFRSLEEVEGFRFPDLDEIPPFRLALQTTEALVRHVGGKVAIGCTAPGAFNVARVLIGMDRLMRGLYKERELVLRVADLACEALIRSTEAHVARGAEFVHYADGTSSPAVISPSVYREYAMPFHKKFFAAAKKMGIHTVYHPCGGEYPILCQVLAMENVDAYHFSELVDPGVARQIGGPRVVLQAGFNPQVLLHGTPEEVEAGVQQIVKAAGKDGRLIMGIGCTMPGDTPPANLAAWVQGTRRYGTYPLRS